MRLRKSKIFRHSANTLLLSLMLMITITSVHFHPAIFFEKHNRVEKTQNYVSHKDHSDKECYVLNYLNAAKTIAGIENTSAFTEQFAFPFEALNFVPEMLKIRNFPSRAPPLS